MASENDMREFVEEPEYEDVCATQTVVMEFGTAAAGGCRPSRTELEVTLRDDPALLSHKLVASGQLPAHLRVLAESTLGSAIKLKRQTLLDERDGALLSDAALSQSAATDAWASVFADEMAEFAEDRDTGLTPIDTVYHELIHSPALHTLLRLEEGYGVAVREVVSRRDKALRALEARHIGELDNAMQALGTTVTDHEVNDLTSQHISRVQMLELNFETELRSLKDAQRRDYHEYMRTLYEDIKKGIMPEEVSSPRSGASAATTPARAPPTERQSTPQQQQQQQQSGHSVKRSSSSSSTGSSWGSVFGLRSAKKESQASVASSTTSAGASAAMSDSTAPFLVTGGSGSGGGFGGKGDAGGGDAASQLFGAAGAGEPAVRLEESFTVQLGTQKKSTHNLRLMAANVLALATQEQDDSQRLATALSLYSNQLAGVVLLVDDRISSYSGAKKSLAALCDRSTDFHFPQLATQLADLQDRLAELRPAFAAEAAGGRATSLGGAAAQATLQPGDFYITNHSNIPGIHVAFNLVVDERETVSDGITTRSPALVGLRNIMRCAFQNSVTHLTIPLLMVSELTEDMDPRWCMRRAELILKCMKGYLVENAAWAGPQAHTIQLLLPRDIDEELFDSFSNMLQTVFRLSNTISA